MKEIVVDGVVYVPQSTTAGEWKIVVFDRGYVYVGRVEMMPDGGITIYNARCLIRWGTSSHLGELENGPLKNTKLGSYCTVRATSFIHTIDVEADKWK